MDSTTQAKIAADSMTLEKHVAPDLMSADADDDGCAEHAGHSFKKSSGNEPCKRGSCSACSSCCVGTAGPPVFVTFILPPKLPEVRHSPGLTLVIGFIPENLERPPRSRTF